MDKQEAEQKAQERLDYYGSGEYNKERVVFPSQEERPQKQDDGSGLGVGLGLLLCGLVCLFFPKYVGTMPTPLATFLYIVGFVALLAGILGACMELSKRKIV